MHRAATSLLSTSLVADLLHWALPRLAIYLAAAVTAAILFVASAGVYALLWPVGPALPVPYMLPSPISVELPTSTPELPNDPALPRAPSEDLIASANSASPCASNSAASCASATWSPLWGGTSTRASSVVASSILGLEIYDPKGERIGNLTDIVMTQTGDAQSFIVAIDGARDWRAKQYVVLPFGALILTSSVAPSSALAAKAERGVVPYTLIQLQKLPVAGHPVTNK